MPASEFSKMQCEQVMRILCYRNWRILTRAISDVSLSVLTQLSTLIQGESDIPGGVGGTLHVGRTHIRDCSQLG